MGKTWIVAVAVVVAVGLGGLATQAEACGHYEGVSAADTLNSLFGDLDGFNATAIWQDGTHAMSFQVTAPDGSTTVIDAHGNGNWLNDAISFLQDAVAPIESSENKDFAG
ncbi:MAG: hypothetical protein HY722_11165 [Planctomycetes bacterium]|nr:hypothetical protein [Planctomycetota bacterium]